jgi:hypothetical protein
VQRRADEAGRASERGEDDRETEDEDRRRGHRLRGVAGVDGLPTYGQRRGVARRARSVRGGHP